MVRACRLRGCATRRAPGRTPSGRAPRASANGSVRWGARRTESAKRTQKALRITEECHRRRSRRGRTHPLRRRQQRSNHQRRERACRTPTHHEIQATPTQEPAEPKCRNSYEESQAAVSPRACNATAEAALPGDDDPGRRSHVAGRPVELSQPPCAVAWDACSRSTAAIRPAPRGRLLSRRRRPPSGCCYATTAGALERWLLTARCRLLPCRRRRTQAADCRSGWSPDGMRSQSRPTTEPPRCLGLRDCGSVVCLPPRTGGPVLLGGGERAHLRGGTETVTLRRNP